VNARALLGLATLAAIALPVLAELEEPGTVSRVIDNVGDNVRQLFKLPGAAEPYRDSIATAEVVYQLPDGLLGRVLYQESRFRPDVIEGTTRSRTGALGIAQFMPATAAELGIDPLDPHEAIDAAGSYLRKLYDQLGDWGKALAAYNWGIGNVKRRGMDAAPKETRDYVSQVLTDIGLI
jgi:soluble lytic murein transglycosylase-like protein